MARSDDVDREVTVIETDGGTGSNAGWFLLGGLLGAGVALLLAPQSGRRTRRQLRRRAEELGERAGDRWDEVVEDVETRSYGDALDTGSAIRARRIDLGYDDDNLVLWSGWSDVYLLWPPPPEYQITWVLPNWPPVPQ